MKETMKKKHDIPVRLFPSYPEAAGMLTLFGFFLLKTNSE